MNDKPKFYKASERCFAEGVLCHAYDTCETSKDAVKQKVIAENMDGPVEISYKLESRHIRSESYETLDKKRVAPSFNIGSTLLLSDMKKTLEKNEGTDFTYIFDLAGIKYEEIWTYVTRKSYLEARVWPLSVASFGILKPRTNRSVLIPIDSSCPSGL